MLKSCILPHNPYRRQQLITNNVSATMNLRSRRSSPRLVATAATMTMAAQSLSTNDNGLTVLEYLEQHRKHGDLFDADDDDANDIDYIDSSPYEPGDESDDESDDVIARRTAKKRRVVGGKATITMTEKEKYRKKLPTSKLTPDHLNNMSSRANARNKPFSRKSIKAFAVPEMKHEYLADQNKFSSSMQKGIARVWSENCLEGRRILPLRFYPGKTMHEKRLKRIIWQCVHPINETVEHLIGEVEIRSGIRLLWGKPDHYDPFLDDTKNSPMHVVCTQCKAILKAGQSQDLAAHAAACNPGIGGSGCEGGCDRTWESLGFTGEYCSVIDGETARQRGIHLARCKGSLEEVKGKLELAIAYQTLCRAETDARLRNGTLGISTKLHPGGRADLMARNSRLTTPFPNEVMDRCIKTFENKAKIAALEKAIRRVVGWENSNGILPAAGAAKDWLITQGYTRERGFFYEDYKAYKEWKDDLNKKIKAGTAVSRRGKPTLAFEFSFNGTVFLRTLGGAPALAKMEALDTDFNLGLTHKSVLRTMKNVRLDWNGLKITKTGDYSGSETGVIDEATLKAWIEARSHP